MKPLFYTLLFCLFATFASAQNVNIKKISPTTFSVGAYAQPFRFERMVEMDASALHLDWAACIMMVLNYNGLNVVQEQIMSLVNGTPKEPLSSPQDLMFAINKTTPHAWGNPSKVFCGVATVDADVIFDELSAGRPLILGTGATGMEGRAFVVTAMSYHIKFDANGQQTGITPQTVTLKDPWPSALASRTINWTDFVGITASLYTVKVEFKK
jgi:hypothetical protein